jgi:hypothetical protein
MIFPSSSVISGSSLTLPKSLNKACLEEITALSNVPPIPTPIVIGGHGFPPASEITSFTNSTTPSFPAAGGKTFALDTFSDPPPFAAYSISILSPSTISKWIIAGKL